MNKINIKKDSQTWRLSGGEINEYNIIFSTDITLFKENIDAIKNNNFSKKEMKNIKHIAKSIGTQIICELFDYIKNEEV